MFVYMVPGSRRLLQGIVHIFVQWRVALQRGGQMLLPSPASGLLVGLGFNGPLRQYFCLYRAVSQREGEREEWKDESKNVQTSPTRTYCKRNRPLPYCKQNCRTPRHWKFTKHHRTTRRPPPPPPPSLR